MSSSYQNRIDRAAAQLSRARLRSFGRPAKIGRSVDEAVDIVATVSAITREEERLLPAGMVEPITATARWAKSAGPQPDTGWFFYWQGSWYLVATCFEHAIDAEWKIGIVDLTRGHTTGGSLGR